MKVEIWVKADIYQGTQVLNEQDYERMKSTTIAEMVQDDDEFEEWLNEAYSPIELFGSSEEFIRTQWAQVCTEAWEDNDGDDWEPFVVEV